MLRLTGFKQFFHTGKTLGNIFRAGNAARMEGTHCQLGPRFADSLCSNGAHGLAYIYVMVCCQVASVAFAADTELGLTGQYRTDPDFVTHHRDLVCHVFRNILIDMEQYVTFFVFNVLGQRPADDTVVQRFNLRTILRDRFNINAVYFIISDRNPAYGTILQNTVNILFRQG